MNDAIDSLGKGGPGGTRQPKHTESAAWFGLSFAAAWALFAAFAIAVKPHDPSPTGEGATTPSAVVPVRATAPSIDGGPLVPPVAERTEDAG